MRWGVMPSLRLVAQFFPAYAACRASVSAVFTLALLLADVTRAPAAIVAGELLGRPTDSSIVVNVIADHD
jgi:hypothetical protein